MDGGMMLVIGKALIWFVVPLLIVVWELIRLDRDDD